MSNYKAPPFTVILTWLDFGIVKKRKFSKYVEAVLWANEYLTSDTVQVKIIGQLVLEESNAEQNNSL